MTLTTHAVIGATVASLFPEQPWLAITVAFASHFLLDALPHWDYSVQCLKKDVNDPTHEEFVVNPLSLIDLLKISIDFTCGIILALMLLPVSPISIGVWLILVGALMGMLPDFLQFIYFKFKPRWVKPFQRLHDFAHTRIRIKYQPVIGITSQVLLVLAAALVVYYS
jgi:hypothetical protein